MHSVCDSDDRAGATSSTAQVVDSTTVMSKPTSFHKVVLSRVIQIRGSICWFFDTLSGPSFGRYLWLSIQTLPEISKFHRLACPLRSHPYLTLCPWIFSTAGCSSLNSVYTSTAREGVTSGTVHLRASNVNSIKGYI